MKTGLSFLRECTHVLVTSGNSNDLETLPQVSSLWPQVAFKPISPLAS